MNETLLEEVLLFTSSVIRSVLNGALGVSIHLTNQRINITEERVVVITTRRKETHKHIKQLIRLVIVDRV
jgi:hypothetical protein